MNEVVESGTPIHPETGEDMGYLGIVIHEDDEGIYYFDHSGEVQYFRKPEYGQ